MTQVWSIKEQVVDDPATGLRFEFAVEDTDKMVLRVYNESGTRVIELYGMRDGTINEITVNPMNDRARPQTTAEREYEEALKQIATANYEEALKQMAAAHLEKAADKALVELGQALAP